MDAAAIFERLQAQFGERIEQLVTDGPDPAIFVQPAAIAEVGAFLKNEPELAFDFLESVSGVDTREEVQCLYHLLSYTHRHSLVLKVHLPYDATELPSVCSVWAAANWLEREQYDMFGIHFTGHPDLRRILLPEDWTGYPLLKSYEYPHTYHGIEHDRPDPKLQLKALDEIAAKARAAAAAKAKAAAAEASDGGATDEASGSTPASN